MPFTPSPQQKAVFAWVTEGTGHGFVEAVAGSGKTTTLIEACKRMDGSVAFTAFNRSIALEIKTRVERAGLDNVRTGTFHSFGFNAWRRVHPDVKVDERGKRDQMLDAADVDWRLRALVAKMVGLAKQSAVGLLWQAEDTEMWWRLIDHHDLLWNLESSNEEEDATRAIEYATRCLEWSYQIADRLIDFDDMIWLAAVTSVKMWQNDWVLVDEAQDTNPARRVLARKMLNPYRNRGRALFVGDRHQAIYGFTGADSDAIDQIVRDFNCTCFPLTVTYRCPKTVVAFAQRWVAHIEAHASAPNGTVRHAPREEFLTTDVPALVPGDAILCRKTAPLVSLAFSLIRRNIPAHVEGRDIGQGLIALTTKWKVKTVDALLNRLDAYRVRETEKLLRKKQEAKVESLNDRIDTVIVLAEGCQTVQCVVDKINTLFRDTNGERAETVLLSTVHKAKGREWSRVFILGFHQYMPSKMAKQDWQLQQEYNLIYVAATRAMSELVTVDAIEETAPKKKSKKGVTRG